EESHMGFHLGGSNSNKSQPVAFVVKTNNNTNNFNRRVNTINNNNANRGPNPNINPNLSKQSGNNNNNRFNGNSEVNHSIPSTSGSLSSSFINEQMMKLLSLINEKPSPTANMSEFFCAKSKYVMYNVTLGWIIDSGANQHMTDSTKDMLNIVDISSLMLNIGHPNGTLPKITAIGSLRLTSGIVLFDVLEYNVRFESGQNCGTGSETGGLYLFDLDKIGECITAKSNYVFVCHVFSELWHCRLGHPADPAKQTREPFPLSDHKSKFVGDIIHCDVWGPYKVTSDDCDNTVKDEVINVVTQIGENVTSEGSVQTNQNNEGLSNVLETSPVLRRSTRQKFLPSKFNDYIVSSNVKYGLEKNNTYVLVDLPPGRKAIGCKWNWKIKHNSSGEIDSSKFMIKDLGLLKCFLGIEVLENEDGLCLSRRKYCLELLSEYDLLACKPAATPLQQNVVLNHEESDNDKFLPNMSEYQKIVGKLIHLSITRPDISYVILKNAPGTSVQLYKGKSLSLYAYSDADWAKCPKTRKSVSESEYRCLASTTCELIWVVKILKDLEVNGLLPAYLYCDSISAISIAGKTKHFEIDLHLVREKVSSGIVKVFKVASANNVVDIFTKGLSIAQHTEFCKRLRLVDMFKP
ncbi:ribonuclease H-like domain-containing protein, partial [Tanacetum coccineum]